MWSREIVSLQKGCSMTEKNKGLICIGLGVLFLAANGWVTVRLLTLVFALILINYGLLRMGMPSLIDCIRSGLSALRFW